MAEKHDAGEALDWTIDGIAQDAGIPVSTVRLYQNRGLLPPPERRGRVGYYDAGHRSRLRLIAHLQGRGFSLAAIKEALDAWAAGRPLSHLLGVDDVAPALAPEPLRLSPAELAARFEGVELSQDDIMRAVELGLVEIDGSEVVVRVPAFAELGPDVARLGVPVAEVLDEYEVLRDSVGRIARRFQKVFERHVWASFVEAGMPPEEVPDLTADVGQLTSLATAVVTTELHDQFGAFAQHYVDQATRGREGD